MVSVIEWLWRCWPRNRIVVLACLSSLLLLAGCVGATDTHVTFSGGENWKLESRLTLSPEELSAGWMDEASFEEYLVTFMEAQSGMDPQDLQEFCTWRSERKGEDYCWVLSCEGQGWGKLRSVSGLTVQTVDKGKLHVTYGPVTMGRSHTLRLTGGSIESSNADEVKGGTAIWYNLVGADQARATVTEARRRRLPCPFALGLGALVVPVALCLGRGRNRV